MASFGFRVAFFAPSILSQRELLSQFNLFKNCTRV